MRRHLLFAVALVLLAACNSSRDKLLADLQSPRPEQRALAVKKLSEGGRPDDLVLFTRAAKDVSALVRGEAATALGLSQDPRVVDLLGVLLEDPDKDVQAAAAMALARIKNDKAKAYLTVQYGRRGRSTRRAIVQALKAANVPGAMAQVVAAEAKALGDRDLRALTQGALPERVAAAEEMGKSGRAEAINRLLPLLKDSQVILAAAAVRGLGYAGDRRAVGPITLLLSENFPELRDSACDALMRLQDAGPLPVLKEVALEKSATSPMALAAVSALPRTAETDQALCELALGADPSEALAAGYEMRKRGGCPEGPILERLARRDAAQLHSAVQGVAGLGPTARFALPRLLPLLGAQDTQLRVRALEAVIALGDPSAAPQVVKLYEQELKTSQALRADWVSVELPRQFEPGFEPSAGRKQPSGAPDAAAQANEHDELFNRLQELNEARAKTAGRTLLQARPPAELVDDMTDEQLLPLATAIRALGVLNVQGAFETLKGHVDDGSPRIRTAAYVGLSHLGPAGIAAARAGLLEVDRYVQGAVAQALAQQGAPGQAVILEILPRLSSGRMALLDALERAGAEPAAIPVLIALVKKGGPEVGMAARLLGSLKARQAVEALLQYLDDPTAVARRDVLLALGKIGDSRAAEVVARDLHHDSPDVRSAAAEALATIGGAAQLEALDALKGDYYRHVRESAEAALARIGAPAGAEPHK